MGAGRPSADTGVEGIDHDRVTEWMASTIAEVEPPLTFELIAGGRSNLTYRVRDRAGHSFALRRPPVSHVLPTAHDMKREHTVISALGPTGVPVPVTYGLCTDERVNGAPFYVMSFVEGHIVRNERAARELDESGRAQAGDSLVDTLAGLHAVDVDEVGLGDFARRDGYIARQLKRWHEQFTKSTVDGEPGPAVVDRVHELLAARVPEQQGVAIVHGDYRLDNTVLDDKGNVIAILDWEICTLGDPLADLGLLSVYWAEPEDGDQALIGVAPTTLPGFARRAQLVSRYADASGLDVSQVPYYRAFGFWKLACILQGVHVRYAGGAAAGDRSGVDQFAAHVGHLGERALAEVESL
ncbi:MAG TPA: phosphotransferase family protein [Acidimicrobiales bacterium]|jgi:aminoglycoside phosphotransferase (APT) family kinase protein|nr:phosphotransferase family protein [Acidimicrobiales bacterium]